MPDCAEHYCCPDTGCCYRLWETHKNHHEVPPYWFQRLGLVGELLLLPVQTRALLLHPLLSRIRIENCNYGYCHKISVSNEISIWLIIYEGSYHFWKCASVVTLVQQIKVHYSLSYLLTYSLRGAESFFRSWLVLQLVMKFPAFYGTRKVITVLTSARHLSLSWANSIQSPQPPPTSRSILNYPPIYVWISPMVSFTQFPHQNPVHPSPLRPIRATCPAHLILQDFTTRTILGKEYRSLSSSLVHYRLQY